MNYSVYHKSGMIIECFESLSNKAAKRYVQNRYTDADTLTIENIDDQSIAQQGVYKLHGD